MIAESFFLAAALLGPEAGPARAKDVARDVVEIALTEDPLFPCVEAKDEGCLEARRQTAMLLTVWHIRESGGLWNIWGDNHTSIGPLQFKAVYLRSEALAPFGATVEDVLGDRKVGLRLGLAWMRYLREWCGSPRRALHAYASGTCAGSMLAREKTKARCALAGLGGC
jgi:hypothetical protein